MTSAVMRTAAGSTEKMKTKQSCAHRCRSALSILQTVGIPVVSSDDTRHDEYEQHWQADMKLANVGKLSHTCGERGAG